MTLAGRTVWITRAEEDAEGLASPLRSRGARVRFLPCIRRVPPAQPEAVAEVWSRVSSFDRVLVGSVAAVELFLNLSPPSAPAPAACVGAMTAQRLREARFRAHFRVAEVAEQRRAEGLLRALQEVLARDGRLEGRRFLFPRAPEGRLVLPEGLGALGAQVEVVETYGIACREDPVETPPAPGDVVTFMSGRTLDCCLTRLGGAACLEPAVVAVIGPVAAERAVARGVRVDVIPTRASAEALAEALEAWLAEPRVP